MKVMIDLTQTEVKYIRKFKKSLRDNPMNPKAHKIPSVQIFLKLAEVVK